MCLASLEQLADAGLVTTAAVGLGICGHFFGQAEAQTELEPWRLDAWQAAVGRLRDAWPERGEARERRRRRELDRLTDEHVAALSEHLDLSALAADTEAGIDWAETDVLFQVQGPLFAMPLAWLPWSDGRPLYEHVASTGTVISLTARHDSLARAGQHVRPPARLLSAHWEQPEKRRQCLGLPLLHAALHGLSDAHRWEVWSLGDLPQATVAHLCGGMGLKSFGAVVIGAHGLPRQAGVQLADDVWDGQGTDLDPVDLLILVSCAIGRLKQDGNRDVQGLYAQLLVNRGRTVVAARWPIADIEAACLAAELMHQYLDTLRGQDGQVRPFDRARALNRARRRMIAEGLVSPHQAAAFEIYGLG
jgi:hypothetical protein